MLAKTGTFGADWNTMKIVVMILSMSAAALGGSVEGQWIGAIKGNGHTYLVAMHFKPDGYVGILGVSNDHRSAKVIGKLADKVTFSNADGAFRVERDGESLTVEFTVGDADPDAAIWRPTHSGELRRLPGNDFEQAKIVASGMQGSPRLMDHINRQPAPAKADARLEWQYDPQFRVLNGAWTGMLKGKPIKLMINDAGVGIHYKDHKVSEKSEKQESVYGNRLFVRTDQSDFFRCFTIYPAKKGDRRVLLRVFDPKEFVNGNMPEGDSHNWEAKEQIILRDAGFIFPPTVTPRIVYENASSPSSAPQVYGTFRSPDAFQRALQMNQILRDADAK